MRIAIDAMGGDNAPKAVVEGAMQAIKEISNLSITLVGNEQQIKKHLINEERISIIHTEEVIENEDDPTRAVRRKKNASLVLMAQEVKQGRADACISAGNTGALVVAGLLIVGRMKGIERPALSPTLPTADKRGFLLLDAGANVDANAKNLVQYGVMGSIYADKVKGIKNPRIGLLNVGTEDTKGNNVTKEAFQLLKEAPINFIGNVESRDLLNGVADVVVTDGFSGNITLKSIEGTAIYVLDLLKGVLTSSLKTKLAAGLIKKDLMSLKEQLDYPEFGGAALFGLKAPVIKSHGSSNERAIFHTIKQACNMIDYNVMDIINETIVEMNDKKEN